MQWNRVTIDKLADHHGSDASNRQYAGFTCIYSLSLQISDDLAMHREFILCQNAQNGAQTH